MASPVKSKPEGWPGGVPGPKWSNRMGSKQDTLSSGTSQNTLSKNIATEMKLGSLTAKGPAAKQKQAVAIGFAKQREAMGKKDSSNSQFEWAKKMQIKAQGALAVTGKGKGK